MKTIAFTMLAAMASVVATAGTLGDTALLLEQLPGAKVTEIHPHTVKVIPFENCKKIELTATDADAILDKLPSEMKFVEFSNDNNSYCGLADESDDPVEMLCIKRDKANGTVTAYYATGSPVMVEIARSEADKKR